jgi:tetratricopeptide (TPR) repeat protein
MAFPMRILLLTSAAAVSALLLAAATPSWAQETEPPEAPPEAPPADVADPAATPDPMGPLIDDPGPLPDIGDAADFGEELGDQDEVTLPLLSPGPVPVDAQGRSVYGLFLAGRSAMIAGHTAAGANYLSSGQAAAPGEQRLRDQTFTSALLAGDVAVAARTAPTEGPATTVQAGRLVVAVRDLTRGMAAQANAELARAPIGFPHARAGLLVQPWIAAAAGDWTRALAAPPSAADPIATAFARYNRALLLEIRRDYAGAEAQFRVLHDNPQTASLFRVPFGEFLERRGRRDEALALYEAALTSGADRATVDARERVRTRGRPPAPLSFMDGAAMGLDAAAAAAMAEEVNEFAVVYLRLSLALKPDDETKLLLGQALQSASMMTAARDVLASVQPGDSINYAAARQQLAWALEEAGQHAEALRAMRQAVAAQPDSGSLQYSLASLLTAQGQYEEALELLNGPAINIGDQAWQMHFQRGAVYESLGRIPEAEAELWAALQLQPESPEVLNYLGYLWVDSGRRVSEGAEMIARAVAAAPDNGHIQDSLGWAQYRQGQFDQAVETLERAISLEPGSAEINDHLGDAYWQVGRRREAGFQWSRVLSLDDADDEMRARAQAKIDGGLEAGGGL